MMTDVALDDGSDPAPVWKQLEVHVETLHDCVKDLKRFIRWLDVEQEEEAEDPDTVESSWLYDTDMTQSYQNLGSLWKAWKGVMNDLRSEKMCLCGVRDADTAWPNDPPFLPGERWSVLCEDTVDDNWYEPVKRGFEESIGLAASIEKHRNESWPFAEEMVIVERKAGEALLALEEIIAKYDVYFEHHENDDHYDDWEDELDDD